MTISFLTRPPHNIWTLIPRYEIILNNSFIALAAMILHFSLKPRTSLFWWVANPLFTSSNQSVHRFAAILLLPIHHLKSCNYRAVRPKPLAPPPISPLFSRPPVRWLLMADTHRQPPKLRQIMSKHRLLLVMSPWQVTGRAGQFSSNNSQQNITSILV